MSATQNRIYSTSAPLNNMKSREKKLKIVENWKEVHIFI